MIVREISMLSIKYDIIIFYYNYVFLFYSDGWEKLGLYEYYKVKNAAKKQKEEELNDGTREPSRSPSPIVLEAVKTKKLSNKRCYR